MILPALRVRSSLATFAIAFALAGAACKSEKSDDTSSTEAVSSGEPGQGGGKHKHALPQAAFDACTGKAAGDACTAQFGDKQIDATCSAISDGRLACRPARKKPEGS
jgi:hypothetical protein